MSGGPSGPLGSPGGAAYIGSMRRLMFPMKDDSFVVLSLTKPLQQSIRDSVQLLLNHPQVVKVEVNVTAQCQLEFDGPNDLLSTEMEFLGFAEVSAFVGVPAASVVMQLHQAGEKGSFASLQVVHTNEAQTESQQFFNPQNLG